VYIGLFFFPTLSFTFYQKRNEISGDLPRGMAHPSIMHGIDENKVYYVYAGRTTGVRGLME
jgi:hypothetical protein